MVPAFNVVFKYKCKWAELKALHFWDHSREEQTEVASLAHRVGRLHVDSKKCMCVSARAQQKHMHWLKDAADTAALISTVRIEKRHLIFISIWIHVGPSVSSIISRKWDTLQTLCLLNKAAQIWWYYIWLAMTFQQRGRLHTLGALFIVQNILTI